MGSKRFHIFGSALILLALLASACARITGDRGEDGRIEYPRGAEDLVLQVHSGGGFVPIVWHLREQPLFSLYGDGRVITQGPQIAIYPPPALPALLERHVSDEGIQAILRAAREAGLQGPDRRFEVFEVTDLPTTTFTVVTDGQVHETAVYGLGEVPDDLPVADREERRTLFEFQSELLDLESWLPEGSVSSDRPYEYDRLRVFVVPTTEGGGDYGGDDQLEPSRKEWPLTGSTFGIWGAHAEHAGHPVWCGGGLRLGEGPGSCGAGQRGDTLEERGNRPPDRLRPPPPRRASLPGAVGP
jgi:hypothetical protein